MGCAHDNKRQKGDMPPPTSNKQGRDGPSPQTITKGSAANPTPCYHSFHSPYLVRSRSLSPVHHLQYLYYMYYIVYKDRTKTEPNINNNKKQSARERATATSNKERRGAISRECGPPQQAVNNAFVPTLRYDIIRNNLRFYIGLLPCLHDIIYNNYIISSTYYTRRGRIRRRTVRVRRSNKDGKVVTATTNKERTGATTTSSSHWEESHHHRKQEKEGSHHDKQQKGMGPPPRTSSNGRIGQNHKQ